MSKIEQLKAEEEKAVEALRDIRALVREEELDICFKTHGLRIGTIVKDNKGKEYKVTQLESLNWGKPWVNGNLKKKDGTWGKNNNHIYGEWTVIEA